MAIDQIDATALATQARQPITLDIVESDKRQISVWKQLLGNQFNFQESRAFTIFLGRSLRWLANRPAEIQSLAKGERNPLASQSPSRVNAGTLKRSDGKVVLANKLSRLSIKQETLSTPGPSTWFRFGPLTWMGILAVTLLTFEWILFQRGKLP